MRTNSPILVAHMMVILLLSPSLATSNVYGQSGSGDKTPPATSGNKGTKKPPASGKSGGRSGSNQGRGSGNSAAAERTRALAESARAAREKAERERAEQEAARERAEREKAEQARAEQEAARQRAEQEAARERAAREAAEARQRELEASLPNAKIESIWVDYDVTRDGKKGMLIHVKFEVNNLQSVNCYIAAYFHFESGQPLVNKSAPSYVTPNGQFAVSETVTPRYVNSVYEDLTLFMPISAFLMPKGKHVLKFNVQISVRDSPNILTESDYTVFTLTQS
jgi:uncharacterized protein YaiL (DUF2058 family)